MNEKLTIDIMTRHADVLRRAVASGRYATLGDVVAEAMDEWVARRAAMVADHEMLRKLWKEGAASGETCAVDLAKLRDAARRRPYSM